MKTRTSISRAACPKMKAERSRIARPVRLLLSLLLLTLPAVVQAEDYIYTTNNHTITITGYAGASGNVSIPDKINGLPVTRIGDYAFYDCISLTSITLPNSITNIGGWAFDGCTNLTRATIPASLTTIGEFAFCYCISLTSITIPNSVTSIGCGAFIECYSLTNVTIGNGVASIEDGAFGGCRTLTAIAVDAANSVYSSEDGVLFNKTRTVLIRCPGGRSGSYTMPSSAITIADYAFEECTSLTSITIPISVTNIGCGAFSACYSLTNVAIGTSVYRIGARAFDFCTGLTSVTIPDSVTCMGDVAFFDCTSLTAITVGANNPVYSSLDGVLFDKSQTVLIRYPGGKAGSYTVPDGITTIGEWAFDGCTHLTSVTIPDSITSIGNSAFGECTSVTSVTIGTNVTRIGNGAFYDCISLTSITLPNSITNIGGWAFDGCTNLTSATIPASLTTIGEFAFCCCISLTSITIPNSVTSIGEAAFLYCASLTNITIPNSVTNIEYSAFALCTSLTTITVDALNPFYSSVDGVLFDKDQTTLVEYLGGLGSSYTIPNSVTRIEAYAFNGCTSLTSVTIPDSVTTIGECAFLNCSSLAGVYFEGSAPNFECLSLIGSPFRGDRAIVYYLPGTTGWGTDCVGRPTTLWLPQIQTKSASLGVLTNQFGFTVKWASGLTVVLEACTNLGNPVWSAVSTNTLTDGSSFFSDSQWTIYPSRFYRIRSL
jgi:hypothetical protein